MAFRSFLLGQVEEGTDRKGVVGVVRQVSERPEVVWAEAVVGPYDLLVAVETAESIEEVVGQLKQVPLVRQWTVLKVDPIPARERMWKNIQGIPAKA